MSVIFYIERQTSKQTWLAARSLWYSVFSINDMEFIVYYLCRDIKHLIYDKSVFFISESI